MKKTIIAAVLIISSIALTGCNGGGKMTQTEAVSAKSINLCRVYQNTTDPETRNIVKEQLSSRKGFSDNEFSLIYKKQIQVGMSQDALFCSWGFPWRTNKSSVATHHRYGIPSKYTRQTRVMVKGGKVAYWAK